MNTGLAVVIGAVLIFYLRLIILQRERAKQRARFVAEAAKKPKKGKKAQAEAAPKFSILSPNRRDWVVGGLGAVMIVVGALLYANVIPGEFARLYWWAPTAVGIVAFSWLFR